MKSVNYYKPGKTSITCSNIPDILILTTKCNDSSILITIIACDCLNLALANEYFGDIKYNQNFLKADQPIRLQYSNQIKLLLFDLINTIYMIFVSFNSSKTATTN